MRIWRRLQEDLSIQVTAAALARYACIMIFRDAPKVCVLQDQGCRVYSIAGCQLFQACAEAAASRVGSALGLGLMASGMAGFRRSFDVSVVRYP